MIHCRKNASISVLNISSIIQTSVKTCYPFPSRYIERLPLMFIFGIATSPSTIQHMLPHSVSSLLCIELFQSLSCTQHLATVIDKVMVTLTFTIGSMHSKNMVESDVMSFHNWKTLCYFSILFYSKLNLPIFHPILCQTVKYINLCRHSMVKGIAQLLNMEI